MNRALRSVLLGIAGLMLLAIGSAMLFIPEGFFASNGVRLSADPSLMSEIRAPGGLLVASAIIVLLGAFRETHAQAGLLVAAGVFGSYGVARLVGIGMDGLPAASLLAATVIEFVVAALCSLALVLECRRDATRSDAASLVA